jgi:hypothetical protein
MKLNETNVIWTPGYAAEYAPPGMAGTVRLERHGTHWQRTPGDRWMHAWCAFENHPGKVTDKRMQALSLFVLFNTLVVRDEIKPEAVHKAFLGIDEYRRIISPDTEGAESAA